MCKLRIVFHNFPNFVYAHAMSVKQHQFTDRRYTFLEILYILQGALRMTLDGVSFVAEPGDCVVIPPGTLSSCRIDEQIPRHSHLSVGVRCNISIIKADNGEQPQNSYSFLAETCRSMKGSEGFESTFEALIKAHNRGDNELAQSLYLQLCAMIQNSVKGWPKSSTNTVYARKITDYIDNNYMGRISIPAVARYLSITPEYASKLFKSATGLTIISYANLRKIEKAKQLLIDGGVSIQYVASMVGIDNMAYFSRVFRKHEGISPNEFRRSLQRKYISY